MNCQWPKCGCAEREQCKPEKPSVAEIDLTQFEGHTPGPWGVKRGPISGVVHGGVAREYTNGMGQDQLAMVCGVTDDNGGEKAWGANTSLIAAAPDLLAAYKAALARAEAAEAEVKRLKLETLRANNEKKRADHYEAQASEAFTAGAEAMREACAKQAEGWMSDVSPHITSGNGNVWNVGSIYGEARDDAAAEIRALPIPAQEK